MANRRFCVGSAPTNGRESSPRMASHSSSSGRRRWVVAAVTPCEKIPG
jgi:hypothetical protein